MLTEKSGLSPRTIDAIKTVLAQFPAVRSAVLYGSRAKGTYRPGSDIDLTLHTTANTPENLLLQVISALDELDSPYSFDLSLYQHLDNAALKEHIQRVGIELYNAASTAEVNCEEQTHRDEVDLDYILNLLSQLQTNQAKAGASASNDSNDSSKQQLLSLLAKETKLGSKRELIEKFIADYMPESSPQQDIRDSFTGFLQQEKRVAIHRLCKREMLDTEAVSQLLEQYSSTGKAPLPEQVFAALSYRPKLLERKQIYQRILHDFKGIIQRFEGIR
ncbi:type I restriction endonuclease subunit R, EcoR124 family [Alkalimonas mucilaginosa]|uniref:Nucleotidyltransferase domain-containing protein n=1 Tax=Alkalimonas mucilaginosa TaxID=3057676 RepID=A0ABU7JCL5_9GAMM|nr:nucleotidyltransferase domain-containing protein [Alkalimonas sp. MEB004]MEE2023240.1 nucleotidyltransferase domain-containing protein [Alkalimonas sp. MEB004]